MKIKILGTRGEIEESCPYHAKHSGLLIDGKLLLDLGEREFLRYKPRWVLITHLHPDHAYFVRSKEKPPLGVFSPKNLKRKIKLGPYTITPIPTHHSKLVKSQAYLIKKGKKSVLYTGDLVWINKKYHRLFAKVDLVITEASFFRKGGMVRKDRETGHLIGHNGMPNLMDLFSKYTKRILFVHFGSWFYADTRRARKEILRLGKSKGISSLIGYDGMELEL